MSGLLHKLKDAAENAIKGDDNEGPTGGYGAQGGSEYNRPPAGSGFGVQGGPEYNTHQPGYAVQDGREYCGRGQERGYDGRDNTHASRDVAGGYSQAEGFARYGEKDYGEEATGFGGHGGRAGQARPEERFDSSSRETRQDEEESLFARALNTIRGRESEFERDGIDEEEAVRAHRDVYGEQDRKTDQDGIAKAAAVQALKMLVGGNAGGERAAQSQSGFVALAMKEASRMFDQQRSSGNLTGSANKQDVVNSAAQMAFKMYLKSQMGGGGGGAGGLMGLAGKFMGR